MRRSRKVYEHYRNRHAHVLRCDIYRYFFRNRLRGLRAYVSQDRRCIDVADIGRLQHLGQEMVEPVVMARCVPLPVRFHHCRLVPNKIGLIDEGSPRCKAQIT